MASVNPLVGTPPPGNSKVSQCVAEIKEALQEAETIGATDKDVIYFLLGSLLIPFNDAGRDVAKIFEPNDSDFTIENKDFNNPITDAVSQISNTVNNPLTGIIGNQGQLFGSTLPDLQGSGGNGLLRSVFDQVQAALRSFFLLGEQSDSNLAGLLLYGIEETMPAMVNVQSYVKKMERLVKEVMEGCSKLPTAFIPEIPNLVIIRNLCNAESQLNTVLAELNQFQTLDLGSLANASVNVCQSRDIVKSGIVPTEALPLLKDVFKLTDLQVKQIATLRFTPDPSFRLKLDQIASLNDFIQQSSTPIFSLNDNVLTMLDTLKNADNLGIVSILQVMITAIQGQIQNLRGELEAEAINFIRQNGISVPDRIVTEDHVGTRIYDASELPTILSNNAVTLRLLSSYSTVINNAATYTELSALCIVLSRVAQMYHNIQKILTQQSKILDAVKKFVNKHIHSACSGGSDASGIDAAVTSFIDSANMRLSGQNNTNDAVMAAGQALLTQLKDFKTFVGCVHGSMQGGRQDITSVLNNIPGNPGHAPTSAGNMADLTRLLPQLKGALRTCDIKRITGVQAKEYDALTKLMDGLQCLAASCDNGYIRDIARLFQVIFRKELDRRKSVAVTQGSIEEVPSVAWKVNVDYRAKSIQKFLRDLSQFINSRVELSCKAVNNVKDATQKDVLVSPSSISPVVVSSRQQQAALEAQNRDAALITRTALSNPPVAI